MSPGVCCSIGNPPVVGDDCTDAIDLTFFPTPSFFVDTTNATTSGPDLAPNCDPGAGPDDQIYGDVWYTYEIPTDGSYLLDVLPGSATLGLPSMRRTFAHRPGDRRRLWGKGTH